jgi:hypothetical protein
MTRSERHRGHHDEVTFLLRDAKRRGRLISGAVNSPLSSQLSPPRKVETMKAKARSRPMFRLAAEERVLLALYRAASRPTREASARVLFHAWVHPSEDEKSAVAKRWKTAERELRIDALRISVFDDIIGQATCSTLRSQPPLPAR